MAELRLDLSKIDQRLLQNYGEELQDEGEPLEGLDPFSDDFSPDEKLSPLERLDKYFQSEDLGERELAVRFLSEAIQHVSSYAEFELLLEIAFALANDHEPIIRVGVLSVVGYLLESNAMLGGEEEYTNENEERLFDVPIRMLADINQQVRRVSQNCVICLLEDEKGTREVLLNQLCPMIVRCLNRDENYDLRMDTALLMSRVASLLGRELCMRHFVPLLPSLGSDTMFHVRKAFAMSCKELCPVLGEDGTEEHILPIFLRLCKDEVWGVRKACADVFSDISVACNLGTRHDSLTPVFLKLLNDDSRWVRKAAFQCLGPFISTFYVPNGDDTTVANFDDSSIDPLGDSVLMDNSLLGSSSLSTASGTVNVGNQTQDPGSEDRQPRSSSNDSDCNSHPSAPIQAGSNHSSTPIQSGVRGKPGLKSQGEGRQEVEDEFSSFSFWRSPIPALGPSERVQTGLGLGDLKDQSPSTVERNCESSTGPGCDRESSRSTEGNTGDDRGNDGAAVSGSDSVHVALGEVGISEVKTKLDFEDAAPPESGTQSEAVAKAAVEEGGEEREEIKHKVEEENILGGLEQPRETTSKGDEELLSPVVEVNTQGQEHSIQGDGSANKSKHESAEQTSHQLSQDLGKNLQQPGEGSQQPREGLRQQPEEDSLDQSIGTSSVNNEDRSSEQPLNHEESQESGSQSDPNTFPPVRVFVHSTCGRVTEQDLSLVGHEPFEDEPSFAVHDGTTTHSVAMDLTLGVESSTLNPPQQEIVPDELMEVFLSMTDHTKAQTVDSELPYYCAYSFPAVALTLGQQHWNVLKPTFDILAADMQWKIRRVLAHSLHELARILGAGRTSSDLLPIFEEYCTKDVDDVKVGVLAHLAEFFEYLPGLTRAGRLPSILGGLVDVENEKNWRYRNTLAEQLMSLCELYDCDYLYAHIYPVALSLAEDKVAEVRATATQLLGILLYLMSRVQPEQFLALVRELRERYATHHRWLFRLMYVKQCESFLTDGRISCEVFASECLPTLLQISKDKVANIRIAVAKLLKDTLLSIDYFQTDGKDTFSSEELQATLRTLQYDPDRDVRYFAGGPVLFDPSPFLQQRLDSESHDSEEQYQDASEYLESETAGPAEAKDTSASSQRQ